jgi:hypothetical protein
MSDSRVLNLTAASALTGTELFYADDGANDVKVSANQIKTFCGGSSSGLAVGTTAISGGTSTQNHKSVSRPNVWLCDSTDSSFWHRRPNHGFAKVGTSGRVLYDNAGTLGEVATTGSGNVVLAMSPSLTTPNIDSATATTINKVVITAPASSATLTIADGKTLTASNTLTFTGTDSTSFAFPSASDTVACLGTAQTFTKTQTITPGTNTNALAVSSYSLTGSNAQALLDLSGTWNTTGTPSAIKLNITDTASNSTSFFEQFQIGGADRYSLRKTGVAVWSLYAGSTQVGTVSYTTPGGAWPGILLMRGTDTSSDASRLSIGNSSSNGGFFYVGFDNVAGGTGDFAITQGASPKVKVTSNSVLGWHSGTDFVSGSIDTGFARNAAGVVEVNNGTAGTFRDLYVRAIGIDTAPISSAWAAIAAGTTARAQINFAASTAPTSPNDRDFWFDGTNYKARVGGVTKTFTIS